MSNNKFDALRLRAQKLLKFYETKKMMPVEDITQIVNELTLHQVELEIQNEDLMKSQSELEESRRKYIELYDLAPIGYFACNADGLITEVNQAGSVLLGLKKHALINRCFARYIAEEHQILFSLYRRQAFADFISQTYELKVLRWNQPSFYAELQCKVIVDEYTDTKQFLIFITDISSRKKIETTLHQQRTKMAYIDRVRSISELVTVIAQEQTNAIMQMNNYLQGCIRRLETNNFKSDEILLALRKVATQSRTVSDSIMTHKTIASKSVIHYVKADINDIIKQTLALLAYEMPEYPVTVQFSEYRKREINVKLDVIHLQQAILNLARNSFEAMRDNRTPEPKLCVEIAEKAENMIEVSVFGNGPGLSRELISKVFEAHYTTKSYGIGLGLTVSRVIIEKHGGQIYAMQNPSGGACFGFTLPFVVNAPPLY